PAPDQSIGAVYRVCRPKYFRTMGLALSRGRDFNEQDAAGGTGVAIINERFVRSHWPNEDPLGKRVTLDDPGSNPKWLTIVGVVQNAKQGVWTDDAGNEVYLPFEQSTGFFAGTAGHFAAMTLVIRTATNPLGFVNPVKNIV